MSRTNCGTREKKHKYLNPKSSERSPEGWWTETVIPAVSPLYDWLRRKIPEEDTWGIVARCFIHTSSSNDLGETWQMLNIIRSSQDTGWCEEVKLLEILIQEIQPHLANQLTKWGKYIAKSDLRKIKKD